MEAIQSFLNAAKLARKQSFKNLTLFPLLAPGGTKPDYLTLEQAPKELRWLVQSDLERSLDQYREGNLFREKETNGRFLERG